MNFFRSASSWFASLVTGAGAFAFALPFAFGLAVICAASFVGASALVSAFVAVSCAAPVEAIPAVGCPAGASSRPPMLGSDVTAALDGDGDGPDEDVTREGSVSLGTVPGIQGRERKTEKRESLDRYSN